MGRNFIVRACVLALVMTSVTRSFASGDSSADPAAVVVDAVIARPACLVATVVGCVLFVVSLPFAIPSKSVHRAAHALVVRPAEATFKRPLGDLGEPSTD